MMVHRWTAASMFLLLFGLSLSCGPQNPPPSEVRQNLRIGLILPLSDPNFRPLVMAVQRGFNRALKAHLGDVQRVIWDWEDDRNLPEEGLFAFQRMVTQEPADFILSFSSVEVLTPMAHLAARTRTLLILPLAGYPVSVEGAYVVALGESLEALARKHAEKLKPQAARLGVVFSSAWEASDTYFRIFQATLGLSGQHVLDYVAGEPVDADKIANWKNLGFRTVACFLYPGDRMDIQEAFSRLGFSPKPDESELPYFFYLPSGPTGVEGQAEDAGRRVAAVLKAAQAKPELSWTQLFQQEKIRDPEVHGP